MMSQQEPRCGSTSHVSISCFTCQYLMLHMSVSHALVWKFLCKQTAN